MPGWPGASCFAKCALFAVTLARASVPLSSARRTHHVITLGRAHWRSTARGAVYGPAHLLPRTLCARTRAITLLGRSMRGGGGGGRTLLLETVNTKKEEEELCPRDGKKILLSLSYSRILHLPLVVFCCRTSLGCSVVCCSERCSVGFGWEEGVGAVHAFFSVRLRC